eukprot:5788079-Pyramimonas_sp.AAC.1
MHTRRNREAVTAVHLTSNTSFGITLPQFWGNAGGKDKLKERIQVGPRFVCLITRILKESQRYVRTNCTEEAKLYLGVQRVSSCYVAACRVRVHDVPASDRYVQEFSALGKHGKNPNDGENRKRSKLEPLLLDNPLRASLSVKLVQCYPQPIIEEQPTDPTLIPPVRCKLKKAGKISNVLAFNEPDGKDQANMTIEETLELWKELEDIGAKLGSPAA